MYLSVLNCKYSAATKSKYSGSKGRRNYQIAGKPAEEAEVKRLEWLEM
jgi:hypothetical protein